MNSSYRARHPEFEEIVLGCALLDDTAARFLMEQPEEIFTLDAHKVLYRAIRHILGRSLPLGIPAIRDAMLPVGWWTDDEGKMGAKWSLEKLSDLIDKAPPPPQIKHYVEILVTVTKQRTLLLTCEKITRAANQRLLSAEEVKELQEEWQSAAFNLVRQDKHNRKLEPIDRILGETYSRITARYEQKQEGSGIKTGIQELDQCTGGFYPGELIIVAARAGVGKTAFALGVALEAAKRIAVALFSVEMTADQIGQRLLSSEAAVNLRRIRTGDLESWHFSKISSTMGDLSELPIYIDDCSRTTPDQISFRVKDLGVQLAQNGSEPIGLVIVDYLQILMPTRRDSKSREREVSSMSQELKQLAKEASVPVMVLSQLNRDLEKRLNKRPILADLRESGAIEQDADMVLALNRPFLYSGNTEEEGTAEIIVLKNRNGPTGLCNVQWVGEMARFREVMKKV